jgi:hypothetical protein
LVGWVTFWHKFCLKRAPPPPPQTHTHTHVIRAGVF